MTRWILFALLLCAAVPAPAQDFGREGFSAGGGLGFASEDFDDDGFDFDDTGALTLLGGYRFHPNFGVDGRFEATGDFEGDNGPFDADVSIWTLSANAQFFILTGQFQPYVLGGLGFGQVDVDIDTPVGDDSDDEEGGLVRLGAGVDAYVTRNIALGVEAAYNIGLSDLDDFNYWTMSAMFRYRF